jgi:hypothetical protein
LGSIFACGRDDGLPEFIFSESKALSLEERQKKGFQCNGRFLDKKNTENAFETMGWLEGRGGLAIGEGNQVFKMLEQIDKSVSSQSWQLTNHF